MKEIIIYVSDDGKEFHSKEECKAYEKIVNRVSDIMVGFRTNKNSLGQNITVRQDVNIVKKAYNEFLELCEEIMDKHGIAEIFRKARLEPESIHPSHIEYHLGDWSRTYPVLWSTYCRFQNINFTSGIEYTQPYYAKHEDEYKWEIR